METDSLGLIPFASFYDTPNGTLRADLFRKAEEIFSGPHIRYNRLPPIFAAPDFSEEVMSSLARDPGTGRWAELSVDTTTTTGRFQTASAGRRFFREGSFWQRLLRRNQTQFQAIPSREVILQARCSLPSGEISALPEELRTTYQAMRDIRGNELPPDLRGFLYDSIHAERILFAGRRGEYKLAGNGPRDGAVDQRQIKSDLQLGETEIENRTIEVILATDFTGNLDLLEEQARYLQAFGFPEVRIHYP